MNRSELVRAVAERAGSDEAAARQHVDAVVETVMERVSAGERVIVTGFGTFDRLSRPARKARNPRTGLPIEVPAAEVPRFRSGQTFRNRVAGSGPTAAEGSAVATVVAAPDAPDAPDAAVSVVVDTSSPKKAKNGGKNGKKVKKGAEAKKPSKKAKVTKTAKVANAEASSKKRPRKSKPRTKAAK
ncbi:HU family DNA-binding protein [Actinomadura sp. 9N215]|uniref:HU family DNA-binding protein n=1 Tax=Actinomadura sp. 9N215 TaxID=3375150 RepID=UPI00378BC76B